MNKREALNFAIAKAGNMTNLAKLCGVSPQAVRAWKVKGEVPVSRIKDVARVTKIKISQLRPDLF